MARKYDQIMVKNDLRFGCYFKNSNDTILFYLQFLIIFLLTSYSFNIEL